jgi:hypothetical protein
LRIAFVSGHSSWLRELLRAMLLSIAAGAADLKLLLLADAAPEIGNFARAAGAYGQFLDV